MMEQSLSTHTSQEVNATAQWNVLAVDDEAGVLRSLQRMLRAGPFRLFPAKTAKDGLFLMTQHSFDIVISDMRMPEMSGAEFLAEVADTYPETIRILMTGYSDLESTIQAVNQGRIHHYIQKPWDNSALLETLEQATEKLSLRRENQRLLNKVEQQNSELRLLNEGLEDKVQKRTQQIRRALTQLERVNRQVKDNLRSTIRVFYNLICLNKDSGGGDALKVAELCRLLAVEMGLDKRQVRDIHLAGLLNELGLIALDKRTLYAPFYALSPEDQHRYREHPVHAHLALAPAIGLADVALIIKHQYERFDGEGVPERLEGEVIPIGARILAVARDYIHALSGRSHRSRYSVKGALALLATNAGLAYDASIIALLPKVVPQLEYDALHDNERVVSVAQLEPGMKLSRNVLNNNDILLLPEGHRITSDSLRRLHAFGRKEQQPLEIHVFEHGGR